MSIDRATAQAASGGKIGRMPVFLILAGIAGIIFIAGHGAVFVERAIQRGMNDSELESRTAELLKRYDIHAAIRSSDVKYDKDSDVAFFAEHRDAHVPKQRYWRRKIRIRGSDENSGAEFRAEALFGLDGELQGWNIDQAASRRTEATADTIAAIESFLNEFVPRSAGITGRWKPIHAGFEHAWESGEDQDGITTTAGFRVRNGRVVRYMTELAPPRAIRREYARHASLGNTIKRRYRAYSVPVWFSMVFVIGTAALARCRGGWKRVAGLFAPGAVWFMYEYFDITRFRSLGLIASVICVYLAGKLLRRTWKERMAPMFPIDTGDQPYTLKIVGGLFIGAVGLVVALLFYGVVTRTGMGWISLQPQPGGKTFIEWGSLWHALWFVAWEDVMFRALLIPGLYVLFRKKWVAIIIPAVLWSLSHISSASVPFYLRMIEVSIIGVIYGIAFLQYGLVAVLIAHWFTDFYLMFLESVSWLPNAWLAASILFIVLGSALLIFRHAHEKRGRITPAHEIRSR